MDADPADPAQPVRRCSRGARRGAAGIGRRAFPWRQAKRAAPQARRREGLKPYGRDDTGGTGRSPKARRRIAPTRHAVLAATGFKPSGHHQCDACSELAGHEATAETRCGRCCDQQRRAPPQWARRGGRPSGRLGLAARPDQVVRAALAFDQAGIDRCRE